MKSHSEQHHLNSHSEQHLSLMVIIVLGVMTTFGPLTIDMFSAALPNVQDDLGTTTSRVQLTMSFATIGLALGQFIFGPLSDIFGRKKVVLILIAVYTVATAIAAFTSGLGFLLALRFTQGLTGGGAIVIAKASVSDTETGRTLARALASLLVVNGIITIAAPLLGGYALSIGNWRTIFIFLAVISVVIFIFSLLKMEETQTNTSDRVSFRSVFKDFGLLLKTPRFLMPMMLQGLTYLMLFCFASAAPFITQNIYHMTPQQFSVLMSINGIGLILMSQLVAFVVKYVPRNFLMILLTIVQLTGVALIIAVIVADLPVWLLSVGFTLNVCPVTGIGPLSFALAIEARTGSNGNAASLLGLFQFILGGTISPLVGLQGESSATPYLIVISITAILIIVLEVFLTRNIHKSNTYVA